MNVYRQTWVEINLDAIRHNLSQFRKWLPQSMQMMAVVKADAYGHGAVVIAKEALAQGASWLGVALFEEALELREAGISAPILVFGHLAPETIPLAQENNISITVTDVDYFREMLVHLHAALPPLPFHLKVDTGMGRLGITTKDELSKVLHLYTEEEQSEQRKSLVWQGMYTHLATADEEEQTYLQQQLACFEEFIHLVQEAGLTLPYIHVANSAGTIRQRGIPYMNLVRLGLSMYGLYPDPHLEKEIPFTLQEAFSLHTKLTLVKKVPEQSSISYGRTYRTEKEEWIGTIPIGYADGWRRGLSNRAEVLVDGQRQKMIGRICMDQSMILLDKNYPRDELVTLIGGQKEEFISIDEIAQHLNTINYEIPCMIGQRVPRRYKEKGCEVN